ncbi:beta-mannosidase-like [Oppia nitens]|uniref:beta-mannosidase-like n=1 Tax=Oppia nitens TaxID=1686743 RepID=UPI0023DA770E|nr:beta-mannosidase-like [Oppia nitens]
MLGKFILFYLINYIFADYLPLDGNQWTAINQNKSITTKARVPGSIYSDLRNNGHLKEGLLVGYNDINYRWVARDNWTYERSFDVDSKLLSKQVVNLVAHGLDTVSNIYINNKKVGQSVNQFVRYKFDVKDVLKVGTNTIRVEFESALHYSSRISKWHFDTYHYEIVGECFAKEYHGECHNHFIRKMPSSYSWDWGPAFPTVGIWKSIGIEANDKAIIRDITVVTTPDKTSGTQWTLSLKAFIESDSRKKIDTKISVSLDDHLLITDQKHSLTPASDGTVKVEFTIPIKDMTIIAWFPNGVANNTQKLYNLKVSLGFDDSKEMSEQSKRIGFRTIEVIQKPVKPIGLTFYFQVNGIPFYAKGTNWIPANNLQEDITPEYLRELMESAHKANMNMMRVWGGGVYESDYLYQLADELGIMIWQDYMFACSLYPSYPQFLETVDQEVLTQVRRLQHHPSIAIWAGNNENEVMVRLGKKEDFERHKKDYIELNINHIRKIILEEDTTRTFVGSSPSNGDEEIKEDWISKHSSDERYGDTHYYNYDRPLWDWKIYPSGKFASEYGYISYSSIETFLTVLNETDLTFPISDAMEHREHHPGGTKSIEKEIGYYFNHPSHGGIERFNDLVYLSQVIQAMAMKIETEFYRRNRQIDEKTGKGNTMGALYWQINDIWPAPTWASIEFGGKWKILQSYAIDFLKNNIVSVYEDNNQTLKISLIRDDYGGKEVFDLSLKVYKWSSNKPVQELIAKCQSNQGFSAEVLFSHSIPDLLTKSGCADRSECVVKVDIPHFQTSSFMLLNEPKNSKLVKPNIKLVSVKRKSHLDDKQQVFDITLSSEAIAPFVGLDFKLKSGIKGNFIENGFFIFDGMKTITFETKSNVTEKQIKDNLLFKTVTDVL